MAAPVLQPVHLRAPVLQPVHLRAPVLQPVHLRAPAPPLRAHQPVPVAGP
jgi:hypothetical protein